MVIRTANMNDWNAIERIYARAREYMRHTGNPNQWGNTSPSTELLLQDIRKEQLYVIEGHCIEGVFALIPGDDPTYSYIEGKWLNDEPYAAIHRVASAGHRHGILKYCLDYSKTKHQNLRIDTHRDNHIMQHLLEKNGFIPCGTIFLSNGDPRIAYHRIT